VDTDAADFADAMWSMGLTTIEDFEAALAETIDKTCDYEEHNESTMLEGFDDLLEFL
tara:strand:- start:312 stop:482 length:171 start_codon:yes stop_codon:yes gene_type:complete